MFELRFGKGSMLAHTMVAKFRFLWDELKAGWKPENDRETVEEKTLAKTEKDFELMCSIIQVPD